MEVYLGWDGMTIENQAGKEDEEKIAASSLHPMQSVKID
jgi:hypothetical protein